MYRWRSFNRPDLLVVESLPLRSDQVEGVPTIGSYLPCLRIAPETRLRSNITYIRGLNQTQYILST